MNEEVDNLSRLWDKPGDYPKIDPMSVLSRSDREDIKLVESFWRNHEHEPSVNEGVMKNVLCHKCRVGFETKTHDRDIACPECGGNDSLSIYS